MVIDKTAFACLVLSTHGDALAADTNVSPETAFLSKVKPIMENPGGWRSLDPGEKKILAEIKNNPDQYLPLIRSAIRDRLAEGNGEAAMQLRQFLLLLDAKDEADRLLADIYFSLDQKNLPQSKNDFAEEKIKERKKYILTSMKTADSKLCLHLLKQYPTEDADVKKHITDYLRRSVPMDAEAFKYLNSIVTDAQSKVYQDPELLDVLKACKAHQ